MRKIMKAEFFKLQKLPFVRMIFLFTAAAGILRGFTPYTGYQVYIAGLLPELFDAVLVSVFTVVFLSTEFSNQTFGNAFLCGTSRKNVFFAKLAAYFAGLLVLIIQPLFVSGIIATIRNGFGEGGTALEIIIKFVLYIICRFSMAAFAIFATSLLRNPIGSLGLSLAGIYLLFLAQNPMEISVEPNIWIAYLGEITVFLGASTCIFVKRDL